MKKSDLNPDPKTAEKKIWDNLTKEYLTLDQKLAIIREHNSFLSNSRWEQTIEALRDYLNDEDR